MPDAKISSDELVTLEPTDFIPAIRGTSNVRVAGSGLVTNPMTTAGDIIIGGTAGAASRLPKGSDGQVLTLASGLPTWATAESGGETISDMLVAEIIVGTGTNSAKTYYVGDGSPVSEITFTALDGLTAGGYEIFGTFIPTATSGYALLYANADYTPANYAGGSGAEWYPASSGIVVGGAYAQIFQAGTGTHAKVSFNMLINLDGIESYGNCISSSNYAGLSQMIYGWKKLSATNITSLRLTHDSGSLAVNSKIILKKRK